MTHGSYWGLDLVLSAIVLKLWLRLLFQFSVDFFIKLPAHNNHHLILIIFFIPSIQSMMRVKLLSDVHLSVCPFFLHVLAGGQGVNSFVKVLH